MPLFESVAQVQQNGCQRIQISEQFVGFRPDEIPGHGPFSGSLAAQRSCGSKVANNASSASLSRQPIVGRVKGIDHSVLF